MKKIVIFMILALSIPSLCFAQQRWKVGIHGAYSAGGDIEDSEAGFGAQAEMEINDSFSVQLAVSKFSDGIEGELVSIDQDVTTIGVSAVWKNKASDKLMLYLLAGLNYNMVDMDVKTDVPGIIFDTDIDNKGGVHFGCGFQFPIHKNLELFAEYRYTLLKLDAELKSSSAWQSTSKSITGDYDFGLIKGGISFCF